MDVFVWGFGSTTETPFLWQKQQKERFDARHKHPKLEKQIDRERERERERTCVGHWETVKHFLHTHLLTTKWFYPKWSLWNITKIKNKTNHVYADSWFLTCISILGRTTKWRYHALSLLCPPSSVLRPTIRNLNRLYEKQKKFKKWVRNVNYINMYLPLITMHYPANSGRKFPQLNWLSVVWNLPRWIHGSLTAHHKSNPLYIIAIPPTIYFLTSNIRQTTALHPTFTTAELQHISILGRHINSSLHFHQSISLWS